MGNHNKARRSEITQWYPKILDIRNARKYMVTLKNFSNVNANEPFKLLTILQFSYAKLASISML